jgi:hypothetical protein
MEPFFSRVEDERLVTIAESIHDDPLKYVAHYYYYRTQHDCLMGIIASFIYSADEGTWDFIAFEYHMGEFPGLWLYPYRSTESLWARYSFLRTAPAAA